MSTATPTSPLQSEKGVLTRRFLGNIFPQTTQEHKEYKAYLKGHTEYSYGKEVLVDMVVPKMHTVRQVYFYQ